MRIGDLETPIQLHRGRKGRVRLQLDEEGVLHLETGNGRLDSFAAEFLRGKAAWIQKRLQRQTQEAGRKAAFLEQVEQRLPLLGLETEVHFEQGDQTRYRYEAQGPAFKVTAPERYLQSERKALLYHSLRAFAARRLEKRTREWADKVELEIAKVRVKDISSRWGSCSIRRNINLNYHLILLDESLIDYVIVHELMHLHEMNHSPRFWKWVEQYFPDYKRARKSLKDYQWMIGILS